MVLAVALAGCGSRAEAEVDPVVAAVVSADAGDAVSADRLGCFPITSSICPPSLPSESTFTKEIVCRYPTGTDGPHADAGGRFAGGCILMQTDVADGGAGIDVALYCCE